MTEKEEMEDFVLNGYLTYIPHVSLDCAIFGYHERQLKLLLIKRTFLDRWCLPGGYIRRTEKLVEAAHRNVRERTGIDNLFLQQFKTFGGPSRYDVELFDQERWYAVTGISVPRDNWLLDQTISIGFYAITDFSLTVPHPDLFSDDCRWFDIDEVPPLEFDHDEMVREALHAMRIQVYHYPIGMSLLPEKFTLSEIHSLYETLLGKKLDVSNFPKKLVALGLLKKLEEKRNIGAHRSPHLYMFDKPRYEEALQEGLVLS